MNGWHRLWLVSCVVIALLMIALSYLQVATTDADFQGDLIRTLAFIWLLVCLAILGVGYLVAWARRGFERHT